MSGHTAPALHVALGFGVEAVRHVEWFIDHVLIEETFFDGAPRPEKCELRPEIPELGLRLAFKRVDAERYRART